MRFAFIDAEKADPRYTVAGLCRALEVSRQGYYAWRSREVSAHDQRDAELRVQIKAIDKAAGGTYGSPRMREALAKRGFKVGNGRVERLLRELGIYAGRKKRRRKTTVRDPDHEVTANVLARKFTTEAPNRAWVTDITYIRTHEGWAYLAVILDLFSRRVVGWELGTEATAELALKALSMAVHHRKPPAGLVFHSDRGCQYTAACHRQALASIGAEVSMSRKGNCWDNAVAESFFSSLKAELIEKEVWPNAKALRPALFEYIEVRYNRQRLHSTLNYETPAGAEENYYAAQAA